VGVESEFSDRLWLEHSLGKAEQYPGVLQINCHLILNSVPRKHLIGAEVLSIMVIQMLPQSEVE
jgi:hypothetical protein